ncbi:biotin--[acetyl-CoA-carboxylase] ligase [Kineosporia sp. J2-2]|uniref:biotin--[biotin carboxyl-carrier protein] ligase n=1 Tax=Kineosporia corallincola TaxID=2835133 RepID=A0ABS5TEG8_9ACTN|nr:biotin--[acetyl-CoA-carboxylase] ligase [Kineosporia corallincola]MBT0767994.1 biotin--[acetyl-CoA-carboxylase] ligase [Kineosporia corallincola]
MSSGPWTDLERPPLRQAALRSALAVGADTWRTIDVVAETASTNADLVARAQAGEEAGAVLIADSQNGGRGRLGRAWTVPPRSALTFSVLLRPAAPVETWGWLSLVAGVAVTDALVRVCGLPASLKWPNDVLVPATGPAPADYAGGRLKIAGILAEASGPAVVIGIGLNVTQDASELPVPTATSLRLAGSATTDRDTVLRAVLRALARRLGEFERAVTTGDGAGRSGVAAAYRERCSTIGATVRAELPGGISRVGLADGVDDDGRLLLRLPGGSTQALAAADVVHVRNPETA